MISRSTFFGKYSLGFTEVVRYKGERLRGHRQPNFFQWPGLRVDDLRRAETEKKQLQTVKKYFFHRFRLLSPLSSSRVCFLIVSLSPRREIPFLYLREDVRSLALLDEIKL